MNVPEEPRTSGRGDVTVKEYKPHLLIFDDRYVFMIQNGQPQALNPARAKAALRFLGIEKEPVMVPARSIELAAAEADDGSARLSGIGAKLISLMADYNEPLLARQVALLSGFNPNTVSSRLSILTSAGLLASNGFRPNGYMVTPAGHAALLKAAAKKHGNREASDEQQSTPR